MATLNVAEHFGIDKQVGGIAPGRLADMLIIPDPGTIRPEWVISNGRVIARNGRPWLPPRVHRFSAESLNSIHLPHDLTAADFDIAAPGGASKATVRVMEMVTDLVTAEKVMELPVVGGRIQADISRGILKIAAVDRAGRPGKKFVGLVRGFGLNCRRHGLQRLLGHQRHRGDRGRRRRHGRGGQPDQSDAGRRGGLCRGPGAGGAAHADLRPHVRASHARHRRPAESDSKGRRRPSGSNSPTPS